MTLGHTCIRKENMSDTKLGSLIDSTKQRDAIHIAVAPVIAGQRLSPGQNVGVDGDGVTASTNHTPHVGIVDPFLPSPVFAGDRFYICLYPGTVTSLRHEWSHPAFISKVPPKCSAWIKSWADDNGIDYDELMANAAEYTKSGRLWSQGDRFEGTYLPVEFWDHFESVTGIKATRRGTLFSCAC